jgi:deazaflavin-dependent oxidoreductase (nitroreductase family)
MARGSIRIARPPGPHGRRRRTIRVPTLLFRAGLGPLLGGRFLLLHHVGRITGRDHQVVLEVLACEPDRRAWLVASVTGTEADWYRNLRRSPKTVVQFGNRHHAVTAGFLTPEEGARISSAHAERRPHAARRLRAVGGLPADDDGPSRIVADTVPFVRLEAHPGPPPPTHRWEDRTVSRWRT